MLLKKIKVGENMKKLLCIGGGEIPRIKNGIKLPYQTREIDEEMVRLSGKKNPKILFIGTASSHRYDYYLVIREVFEKIGGIVTNLDLLTENIDMEKIEEQIFNTDIIYVGGGNTRFMLEKWRELGVDKLLIEAYNKGIVCSGLSAGSYCWFKCNYDLIEGLGLINAVNCVHYEQKDNEAKQKFLKVIKDYNLTGYALENCTALEIIDGKEKIIKSNPDKNAYKIYYEDGEYKKIQY